MLGKKVSFKKAKIPKKIILNGKYVKLEPIIIKKHGKFLFENFQKDQKNIIWKYLPYGPFNSYQNFSEWLRKFCLSNDPFFYAIYSKKIKQYCGMAGYLNIVPDHGTIEVGHINYSPILQNSKEGTEAMFLMMSNVFNNLGYRRYEWKCNNLNNDSKKAAKRLGFKYEGLFRQMFVIKGRNRDTAWFSILDKEWKNIEKNYSKYLSESNFDEQDRQKNKLQTNNDK